MKRYYLAYGSNLNVPQMRYRCPKATILGTGYIPDYELLFKGSKTGSYLTIEASEGGKTPVAVWEVTDADEKALDRYEGYPNFYYKKEFKIRYKGIRTGRRGTINAFAYIMHEERRIGMPSDAYMWTCIQGYKTFGFDRKPLMNAYRKSRRLTENEN